MPTLSSLALPPPRNWQDFEDLCCDLWRRLWADPAAQKNGRGGQLQAGVDVFGRPSGGNCWEGVQCKLKGDSSTLTRKDIEMEVKRAQTFEPALSKLVIATTAQRDANSQKEARKLTAAQIKKKSFSVSVVSWEDILLDLASFPDLVAKHFPFTNIIVQKVGDGHKPVPDCAHLALTRYLNARVPPEQAIGLNEAAPLLSPYAASVPLIGREDVLADLWAWMRKDRPVSVRVLTAPAGTGKTRLALDLCEAAVHVGWVAGFLREAELVRFRGMQNLSTWGWSRPTLIVVDYAASLARLLRDWLAELADHSGQADQPLRLLLLERHADSTGGWWREAFGPGAWHAEPVQALLDPPSGPYSLPPLTDPEQRRAVVTSILERTGSPVRPPEPGTSLQFDRRLAEISWGGEPLFLLMAGLVAARAGFGEVLALSATDLAFRIARREIDRLEAIARSRQIPGPFLTHLAAYTTLCQGLSQTAVEAIIEEEKEALHYRSAGDIPAVYQALAAALPSVNGDVAPVLPDVVGEALILETLGDCSAEKALAAASRAASKARERVTATLIHLAQDYGSDPQAQLKVLGWFDRVVAERGENLESLDDLIKQLPPSTLVLREPAATLTERAVEICRKEGSAELLARLLDTLSFRLIALGQTEKALAASEEAVGLYQEIAAAHPDACRANLARSLSRISLLLSKVGRIEESLAAGERAMAIRRELAASKPTAFRPHLATSFNNRSALLHAAGRTDEALAACKKSVGLYRDLDALEPGVFRPHLAQPLRNLSIFLSELGRWEEALAACEEAVESYREAAAVRPDAFQLDLANALYILSGLLSDTKRGEEALIAARESAELYRNIAGSNPSLCLPELVVVLNRLTILLQEADQEEEALASGEEAVELCRALAASNPEVFRPELAIMLENLSILLRDAGQEQEALNSSKETVELYKALAASNPADFQPDLANSLNNFACDLSNAGKKTEALAVVEEAVDLYRNLAVSDSDAFLSDLTLALSNLSVALRDIGQIQEAIAAIEEAVRTLSPNFLAYPSSFQEQMKDILQKYLKATAEGGREPDQSLLCPIEAALALG